MAEGPFRSAQVTELITAARVMLAGRQSDNREPLVTLEPDEDGAYVIDSALAGDLGISRADEADDDENDEDGDNRQIVFLDARALRGAG